MRSNKRIIFRKTVEITGYACWLIGILCLILARLLNLDIQASIYLFASGLAVFGIGTGFIGLGVAQKSDERMQAIAKIEEELNTKIQMLMDKAVEVRKENC